MLISLRAIYLKLGAYLPRRKVFPSASPFYVLRHVIRHDVTTAYTRHHQGALSVSQDGSRRKGAPLMDRYRHLAGFAMTYLGENLSMSSVGSLQLFTTSKLRVYHREGAVVSLVAVEK